MKTLVNLLAFLLPSSAFSQNKPGSTPTPPGEIPNISQHYHALPVLYHFEETPAEKMSDLISRQYIYGAQSMLVKWIFKKGAVVPLHHHSSEQITWITQGSMRVNSQGQEFILKAGDVFVIPPNVPHAFFALEDTIDIDIFAPARQDWLDETAGYLGSVKK